MVNLCLISLPSICSRATPEHPIGRLVSAHATQHQTEPAVALCTARAFGAPAAFTQKLPNFWAPTRAFSDHLSMGREITKWRAVSIAVSITARAWLASCTVFSALPCEGAMESQKMRSTISAAIVAVGAAPWPRRAGSWL